jgi:hypothetical protein
MSPTTSDLEIRAGNWPILREPKFPYVPGVPDPSGWAGRVVVKLNL